MLVNLVCPHAPAPQGVSDNVPWNMGLDTIANLRGELEELKEERTEVSATDSCAPHGNPALPDVISSPNPCVTLGLRLMDSAGRFSEFHSTCPLGKDEDGDIIDEAPLNSVLLWIAKFCNHTDELSEDFDKPVAHLDDFDGLLTIGMKVRLDLSN